MLMRDQSRSRPFEKRGTGDRENSDDRVIGQGSIQQNFLGISICGEK